MACVDTSNSRMSQTLAEIHNTVKYSINAVIKKGKQQIKPRSGFVSLAQSLCGFHLSLNALTLKVVALVQGCQDT